METQGSVSRLGPLQVRSRASKAHSTEESIGTYANLGKAQENMLISAQGTWQFISALLLLYPGKFTHEVWHDLESFIHVLHWCCFRFHQTDCSSIQALQGRVYNLYDMHLTKDGISIGGTDKLFMLRNGNIPFTLSGGSADSPRVAGLHRTLTKLASLYKEHYQWLQATGKLPKSPKAPSASAPIHAQPKTDVDDSREARSDVSADEDYSDEDADDDHSEDAVKEPLPVLNDHSRVIRILSNALTGGKNRWVYDEKGPDNFAQFKNSPPAQRARASSQSLKRLSDDSQVDDKPAKRARKDGGSTPGSLSNPQRLGSISEDISSQAD